MARWAAAIAGADIVGSELPRGRRCTLDPVLDKSRSRRCRPLTTAATAMDAAFPHETIGASDGLVSLEMLAGIETALGTTTGTGR